LFFLCKQNNKYYPKSTHTISKLGIRIRIKVFTLKYSVVNLASLISFFSDTNKSNKLVNSLLDKFISLFEIKRRVGRASSINL
jgi:hypothetical protein